MSTNTQTAEKAARMKAGVFIDRGRGRKFYRELGSAFPHKEGPGFNVVLDLPVPPGLDIVVLPIDRKDDAPQPEVGGEAEPF